MDPLELSVRYAATHLAKLWAILPGAKMYCVVEFPKSNLTGSTVVRETDPKLVAIPLCEQRCEKGCCSIKTLPLRVCYALTVHKVQGMSIGPGETFEKRLLFTLRKVVWQIFQV